MYYFRVTGRQPLCLSPHGNGFFMSSGLDIYIAGSGVPENFVSSFQLPTSSNMCFVLVDVQTHEGSYLCDKIS